jgi:hypothetical protein
LVTKRNDQNVSERDFQEKEKGFRKEASERKEARNNQEFSGRTPNRNDLQGTQKIQKFLEEQKKKGHRTTESQDRLAVKGY